MRFGLASRNERSWSSWQLIEAMKKAGVDPVPLKLVRLAARVGHRPAASTGSLDLLQALSAMIVRPIGGGSLEKILFRMDLLYRLERLGLTIVNPPKSIEKAVDKYYALTLLEEAGLPVPRTVVTESVAEAKRAFHQLGGDVVLKPLTGSRGIGSTRITDQDVAERIFRALSTYQGIFYLQEYVPHGFSDIRALVIGDRVGAAMRRVSEDWKTNVSQGATPVSLELESSLQNLAIKASEVVGCTVAGVDILESTDGPKVIEVNSQPGWKGLQQVTRTNIAGQIIEHVIGLVRR